jgi:hypothetical protein
MEINQKSRSYFTVQQVAQRATFYKPVNVLENVPQRNQASGTQSSMTTFEMETWMLIRFMGLERLGPM